MKRLRESTLTKVESELLSIYRPHIVYLVIGAIRKHMASFESNVGKYIQLVIDNLFDLVVSEYINFEKKLDKNTRGEKSLTERILVFLERYIESEEFITKVKALKFNDKDVFSITYNFLLSHINMESMDELFEMEKIATKIVLELLFAEIWPLLLREIQRIKISPLLKKIRPTKKE